MFLPTMSFTLAFVYVGLVCWFLYNQSVSFNFWVVNVSSLNYWCSFHVGLAQALFWFMIGCCCLKALIYSYHYYNGYLASLVCLILSFSVCMISLVSCSGFASFLVFWEFLGIISILMILEYGSPLSCRSCLVVSVVSRLSDIFIYIVFVLLNLGGGQSIVFSVCSAGVVISKSAIFPLGVWLLEAMRAPVPVSSLVHSSTLVVCGFCYMYIFRVDILEWLDVLNYISTLAWTTLLISCVCALWCNDLKKLVALSTCNNVSWCVTVFIDGNIDLSCIMLVCHGGLKCIMFMLLGDVFNGKNSCQSVFSLYGSETSTNSFLLDWIVFSLCGLPLFGLYFSKHNILLSCSVSEVSLVWVIFVSIGFLLSCAYLNRFLSTVVVWNSIVILYGGGSSVVFSCGLIDSLLCSSLSSVLIELGLYSLVSFFIVSAIQTVGLNVSINKFSCWFEFIGNSFFGCDWYSVIGIQGFKCFYKLINIVSFAWEELVSWMCLSYVRSYSGLVYSDYGVFTASFLCLCLLIVVLTLVSEGSL